MGSEMCIRDRSEADDDGVFQSGKERRVTEQPHKVVEAVHLGQRAPHDPLGKVEVLKRKNHAIHGIIAENQQIRKHRDQHDVQQLVFPNFLPERSLSGVQLAGLSLIH